MRLSLPPYTFIDGPIFLAARVTCSSSRDRSSSVVSSSLNFGARWTVQQGPRKSQLQIVSSPALPARQIASFEQWEQGEEHSLHGLLSASSVLTPHLVHNFLLQHSKPGETVLDPFADAGTVALEAALLGRRAVSVTPDPLAALSISARLNPADLTEATLCLQDVDVQRPVSLEPFHRGFSSFYDVGTFRELANLRVQLGRREGLTARFVAALAASLMHGPSAGYFSVYSPQAMALPPDAQERLNTERRQSPEYRATIPRILRKAAGVLRDGCTSTQREWGARSQVGLGDAKALRGLPPASVDMVITSLPAPEAVIEPTSEWLKHWFLGVSDAECEYLPRLPRTLEEWFTFTSGALAEIGRVLHPQRRAVFVCGRAWLHGAVDLHDVFVEAIQREHGSYFEVESVMVPKVATPRRATKPGRVPARKAEISGIIVARRR